jgi:hypothetical protein
VRSRGPHEDVTAPDNFNHSLTDASIFPYDINVGGLATDNHQQGKTVNVFLEHQFSSNFVVEAAFQKQVYDQVFTDWIRGGDQSLRIDVNRFIPNVTDSAGRPVLNPNRGKYFIESWGRGNHTYGHTESARVTGSYRLDFQRKPGWQRWLGTHNLAGLVDLNRTLDAGQNQRSLIFSDSPDVNIRNPANRSDRSVVHRVYLDAPGTGGTSFYDVYSAVTQLNAQPYGPAKNATVALRPPDLTQGVWAVGNIRREETRGKMFALQSLFWEERIVLTYGKRNDRLKSLTVNSPVVDGTTPAALAPWYAGNSRDIQLVSEPKLDGPVDLDETGTKETRGLVVSPLSFVSFHYNQSSNRQPGSPGRDPNGGFYEPSSGEGKDYGLSLRLFHDRVFLKANWYENTQTRNGSSEFGFLKWNVSQLEQRLVELAAENPGLKFVPPSTWDPEGDATISPVLSDFVSKGLEITLTANPLRNWRVSLSAAKTDSVETNIAQAWEKFIAVRTPEWQKFYSDPRFLGGVVAQGGQTDLPFPPKRDFASDRVVI